MVNKRNIRKIVFICLYVLYMTILVVEGKKSVMMIFILVDRRFVNIFNLIKIKLYEFLSIIFMFDIMFFLICRCNYIDYTCKLFLFVGFFCL